MEKYDLKGHYEYNGAKGKLTGEMEVNSDGLFESTITDHMSRVPEQRIKGKIMNIENVTKLGFFKFQPNEDLANLVYRLQKSKSDDFSGKYFGRWAALPYKVEFNQELGIILVAVDMKVCLAGDYAEINLSRR